MYIREEIDRLESEARKEELNYRLTGDFERLCKKNMEINKEISALAEGLDRCETLREHGHETLREYDHEMLRKHGYNNLLKYAGDLELKYDIETKEKSFRSVRKQISKEEYEERLRELILLRNEFAQTAGFRNFLEYKYAMWGVDEEILAAKMDKTYAELSGGTAAYDYVSRLKEFEPVSELNARNQIGLLEKFLDLWNLKLDRDKVKIYTENLPQFYAGACVPVSVPDDVCVLMNLHSGLSGFAVFAHEIGHAYYYSNISDRLPPKDRGAFNLMTEEGVALLFENLAYNSRTTKELFGIETDLYENLIDMFAMEQMRCIEFEKSIYREPDNEFDVVWNELRKKYDCRQGSDWRKPHFFVSDPGYFAAYFLGNRLAKVMYDHARSRRLDIGDFLTDRICSAGGAMQFEKLLEETGF